MNGSVGVMTGYIGQWRAGRDQTAPAVEAQSPEDPFATPEYAAIRGEAQDYLRSVFSGDRFGEPRCGAATGSDPP